MTMKFIVMNNSGNVGKSFIAREVLYANMEEPRKIFDFESYNTPNSVFKALNAEIYTGKNFKEMLTQAAFIENAVLDVGSSNILDFLEAMRKYAREMLSYDYFIVPTVLDDKQDTDACKILEILSRFRLQEKTRIIFNRYNALYHDINKSKVKMTAEDLGFAVDSRLTICENTTVNELSTARLTLDEILNDDRDFKSMAIKEKDSASRIVLYERHLLQVSSETLKNECTNLWNIITGDKR